MMDSRRTPRGRLVFETHTTSLDNEVGLASGWFDVNLSQAGERQASSLGTRYAEGLVQFVFCSDLWRSWRTAELAFGDRAPIVRDLRLREIDYGQFTRKPVEMVDARRMAHLNDPFPEGESYAQVVDRVRAFLDELDAADEGRLLLVVGHRATFYALEHVLRGRPLAEVVSAPWAWQPGWTYELPPRQARTSP
jgi:broad specificity phosphatase PhoE